MHALRRLALFRHQPDRHGYFSRLPALLAGITLAVSAAPAAAMTDAAIQKALDDAREKRFAAIDQRAVDAHILHGYVDYHRLRAALPEAAPERVNAYLTEHADSPLAGWMRGQAISAYGDAGRHDALLAVASGKPSGVARQCHYATALLGRDAQTAGELGRELWLAGTSRPSACDTLFERLRSRGMIDDQAVWNRAMLAWQAGNTRLMDYLLGMLGSDWRSAAATAQNTADTLADISQGPDCLGPRCAATDGFYKAAMARLIREDTDAAFSAWQRLGPRVTVSPDARRAIQEELAFYALVRETPGTLDWVDGVLPTLDSERVRELRVRRALADRAWREVRYWIEQMPGGEQENSRWQYWLARANEQLCDRAVAQNHYRQAATERDFYGFAAAERLGQPYAFNMARYRIDDATRQRIAALPAVRRAEALIRIDEPGLATSEWLHAVHQADPQRARELAAYAALQSDAGRPGWPARLVQITIAGKMWDALEWRFPQAYREAFERFGQRHGVDPYLLMAIARRESAYNPSARSPAGALGLMQLMPGTARDVSRSLGLDAPGPYGVLDPELNIRLGSTYFRDTLERYRGNRLAATAAYNAGPSRVDRWLGEHRAEQFDLFVESIPYRETRHYVQAVLTYRAIFQRLAQGDAAGIRLLSEAEQSSRYSPSLLSRESGS